jgi:hypothetical protein
MNALIDYLNKTFSIDSNTSSTIIITLLVFILGYLINSFGNIISNLRTRLHYRKIYRYMIESISSSCLEQSKAFKEFSDKLSIENPDLPPICPVYIKLLSNFQKIPFEIFYNSFFKGPENFIKRRKNLRMEGFNEVFSNTESLGDSETKYPEDIKDLNSKYQKYLDQWNNSFERILRFIEDLLIKSFDVPDKKHPEPFYLQIDAIMSRWQGLENYTHYNIIYNQLILPLDSYINEPKNQYYFKEIKPLLDSMSDLKHIYLNFEYLISSYHSFFDNYSNRYKARSKVLKEKINLL